MSGPGGQSGEAEGDEGDAAEMGEGFWLALKESSVGQLGTSTGAVTSNVIILQIRHICWLQEYTYQSNIL